MQPNERRHPLLGKYDLDPGRWRPLYYQVEISVPVALGGRGIGSLPLNAQPYILTRVQAKIIGETADAATTGLYQDGQFDVEFKDEQANYQSGPMPADLMYGGPQAGYALDLPYPIPFAGNKSLTFEVTNRVLRVLASAAEYFTVGISLAGIADWGDLTRK
jgi:hypothetical protein